MSKVSELEVNVFRVWLNNPAREGRSERFWVDKARLLLACIDELEEELEEFRKDRKNARNCTATYWMNYGEKVAQCHIDAEDKLRAYEEAVEPIVKEFDARWASRWPDSTFITYYVSEGLKNYEADTSAGHLCLGDLRRLVEIREGK